MRQHSESWVVIFRIGIWGYNEQSLAANSQIEQELHTTASKISLSLSLFILVQGNFPVIWSAVSEIKGRKVCGASQTVLRNMLTDLLLPARLLTFHHAYYCRLRRRSYFKYHRSRHWHASRPSCWVSYRICCTLHSSVS